MRTIQRKGLEVSGGFILGLDGDGPEVFEAQIAFIQEAGIPRAMVGLLSALRGTDLHARLEAEGRLLGEASGNNVEIALNFRPQIEPQVLIEGYRRVLAALYEPSLESYFARCWTLVSNLGPGVAGRSRRFETAKLLALLRSVRRQLLSRQAPAYVSFLLRTLLRRPRRLRRLHRRLRPEFRSNLVPDLFSVDQAIQACVREAPALDLLHRIRPLLKPWFAGPSWRGTLEAHGYSLVEGRRVGSGVHTLALAPLIAQGRLRRSFEQFLRELGIQVITLRDQVAQLGEERLESLLRAGDAPERLVSYLRALGRRADALVVPFLGEAAERLQVLSAQATSSAARPPHVVCVACRSSRSQLRANLVELGTTLTDDPVRAEIAFDRSFALL